MRSEPRPVAGWPRLALRVIGSGLLAATAAALGLLALTPAPGAVGRHQAGAGAGVGARLRAGVPHAGWLVTGVSVLALALLGGSVAAAGGVPTYASAGGGLKTAHIGGT